MSELDIFHNLNPEQYEELKNSLALVTVLIAGADGNIDEQELNWAEKLTQIRTYANPEELNSFYGEIQTTFSSRVQNLINELPDDTVKRQKDISKRLTGLNEILPLIENKVSHQIYESLTSFAEHIAKASGGFLRFGSISKEEKKWIDLPMIEPVILVVNEEEDE